MSIYDSIDKINRDIQGLPAEYRSLVKTEENWASANPLRYAGMLLGLGFIAGIVTSLFF